MVRFDDDDDDGDNDDGGGGDDDDDDGDVDVSCGLFSNEKYMRPLICQYIYIP